MATKRKAPVKGASSTSRKKSAAGGGSKSGTGAKRPVRKKPAKKKAGGPGDLIQRLLKRAGSPRKRAASRAKKKGLFSISPGTLQVMYGLAAGLVLSGAVLWLLWPSPPEKAHKESSKEDNVQIIVEKPSRPAPAEKSPVASAKVQVYEENAALFNRHLALTDAAILQTLRSNGLGGTAVRFNRIRNVVEDGLHYERAEMALDLGDLPPAKVEEKLLDALGRLNFPVTLISPGTEGEEIRLEVRLEGRLTHLIRLHPGPARAQERAEGPRRRAAIIIDDLGNHPKLDARFAGLDLELTLAVLPHGPATREAVREVREKGREMMLHLPMEPQGYPEVDPGPGALLTSMSRSELATTLNRDLEAVPLAVGVNNHMGSRLTEDAGALEVVFRRLKERGLFFVDSRTTSSSRVEEVAARVGLKTASRSVFLDNVAEPGAVQAQVQRLLAKAAEKDGVIAIGHPHPATLETLAKMAPLIKERLELVPVSTLVR